MNDLETKPLFANHIGYSDVNPWQIIRIVSRNCVVIRAMTATRDQSVALKMEPGGFSAVCTNQHEQRWIIKPNESGTIKRIRRHKDGMWRSPSGSIFRIEAEPRKFYDFNF
jgi:hypothetical protein